ncbi:dihydrofolate reductase [Chitinophaga caeni]|uniref:Dihydrofolate reductase n=1 Tax=Chitinophaga caeni TaxID=2029983 RepID=A0A291QYY5_9BACT|nr:dihydrofolate reductase family protein [Chitinophaga caeni]ATL49063.1 dihydrofolate reductase [Chitinophaga caeni]
MRKIIVLSMISLDGIMQGPGGPGEDTSGGFKLGGWTVPFFDEEYGKVLAKQMQPADYLLGRKTFEIFENYWPEHGDFWPGINSGTKYVLSGSRDQSSWQNSIFLKDIAEIKKLKQTGGHDLHVYGSSELIQLLLEHDVADELWLKIYPVTLGQGKKLFGKGTFPGTFKVTESTITPSGVIIINYKRAGELVTGTVEL